MRIKIRVLTPKNKAEKSVETLKGSLLGLAFKAKIEKQEVTAHNEFYWILNIDPNDLPRIHKKAVMGEVLIRTFYSTLFRVIHRANKLASKFKKGISWIRRFIHARLAKVYKNNDSGMMESFDKMTDEELKDYLNITDKEEIQSLISNQMIFVEELDAPPNFEPDLN